MRYVFLLGIVWMSLAGAAQQVTFAPIFPKVDQPLTLTVDVTGSALAGFAGDVYIWTWIPKPTGTIDAPTNVNPATAAQAAAKWTRLSANVYEITFTPTTFFNRPASDFIDRLGFLLKGPDWTRQTADLSITFFLGFAVQITQPAETIFFVNTNDQIPITGYASQNASLVIKVGGDSVAGAGPSATTLSHTHTVTETSGSVLVEFEATTPTPETKTTSFSYVVRSATVTASRPPGIIDGINYPTDQTKATLGLWAPGKTSVYILGDFNNWTISPAYQMKRDGEHFWLEITGLTPGTEYGFQYLVDESLRLADPYADKILDPDDQYIPVAAYPGLKPYPAKALNSKWYYNRVAVLQTGQTPYPWVVTNFSKPPKENLVIYELLIRDFFSTNARNYQNLIDTLGYLKRLGVNAIELMPFNEFNGNESWGYNPTFLFAPDKYYGTKNKLKEFIDKCHQQGIAVIMDMVMNHHDTPNPYVMMDFDFNAFKPTANNKWFNTDAKHPFNVFFDMNHESSYTKKYLDTVNYYWLNEYKIDGYRYDLSKGFTQVNNPNDVNAWGAYDASRIAILKRMADKIRVHTPNAYIILEHFAANNEEKELAEYGMMLWANLNYSYNQNTIGLAANSDVSWIYHGTRGWNVPHAIGYMESHDEDRLMFRNLQQGMAFGNYNVKDLNTALERMKVASMLFYTIPGPKMLWQFGELGYDISIDQGGRVSPKPVKWDYLDVPARKKLNRTTESLIKLKTTYPIFSSPDVTLGGFTTLQKQIMLRSLTNFPSGPAEMNAVIIGNFDVTAKSVAVTFPHTGNWYHYFSGGDIANVTSATASMTLEPGEGRIYTDVLLPGPGVELVKYLKPITPVLLSVTEGNNNISVSWDDRSSIETGYTLYKRTAGGQFAVLAQLPPNLRFHVDFVGLFPLTEYEYYVEANNPYGSSVSQILSITTSNNITGLEDEWRDVRIYPNPTNGMVTIEVPPALAAASIVVRNAMGQAVGYKQVNESTLDIRSSPPGLYLVVVTAEGKSRAFKIIKQ
ncbi:MAG: alpha-amylase family glycosyl hydrolase [Cytophagales bacterium]|nr:alpha-amylase family glycosyl hydrolase [Cytophagales bacterium]